MEFSHKSSQYITKVLSVYNVQALNSKEPTTLFIENSYPNKLKIHSNLMFKMKLHRKVHKFEFHLNLGKIQMKSQQN